MSEKKKTILAKAINIIQRDGYAALTMRQLASESEMKLASLQYHFKTWDALIEAIAKHILEEYAALWNSTNDAIETVSLPVFIEFILGNIELIESARLWPQLRAWGLVEPRMKEMLADIYSHYINFLTHKFSQLGCPQPKLEALAMISMLEGASVFVGRGSPFFQDLEGMKNQILENIEARFGADLLNQSCTSSAPAGHMPPDLKTESTYESPCKQ